MLVAEHQHCFPRDFNFEVEEVGCSIRFLTARVFLVDDQLEIMPECPNLEYARGRSDVPWVSRCPRYVDRHATPSVMLRRFMLPTLHTANSLVCSDGERDYAVLGLLVLEVYRCGWPEKDICSILRGVGFDHRSKFFHAARELDCNLRHDDGFQTLKKRFGWYA